MSNGDFGDQNFEEKIRAIFKEVSQSIEQAAENIDLDEIADRLGVSSERVRFFAESAGQWLSDRFAEPDLHGHGEHVDDVQEPDVPLPDDDLPGTGTGTGTGTGAGTAPRARRTGPHPRDLPTEDQGLALSGLDSGRWKVKPGTNELISSGEGPDPQHAAESVGDLRARDWIASSGELTLAGRDALRRWLERTDNGQ